MEHAVVSQIERLADEFAELPLTLVVRTVVDRAEQMECDPVDAVVEKARADLRRAHVRVVAGVAGCRR